MMGKTHDVVGVTTAVGVGYATDIGLAATGVLALAALAGSRLPDNLEGGILPHRGVTHRLWFVAVIAAAVWLGVMGFWQWGWFEENVLVPGRETGVAVDALGVLFALLLAGGIALGYAMHLVADMCTIHGLNVGGKRVHLLPGPLRIRTGGIPERFLRLAIYMAWVAIPALLVTGCGGSNVDGSGVSSTPRTATPTPSAITTPTPSVRPTIDPCTRQAARLAVLYYVSEKLTRGELPPTALRTTGWRTNGKYRLKVLVSVRDGDRLAIVPMECTTGMWVVSGRWEKPY